MIIWVAGLVVCIYGMRAGLAFWAPIGSLVLMLPLPPFVYWPVLAQIERAVAAVGAIVASLGGVSFNTAGRALEIGGQLLPINAVVSDIGNPFIFVVLLLGVAAYFRVSIIWGLIPIVVFFLFLITLMGLRIGMLAIIDRNFGLQVAERFLQVTAGYLLPLVSLGMVQIVFLNSHLRSRWRASCRRPAEGWNPIGVRDPSSFLPSTRVLAAAAAITILASGGFLLVPDPAPQEVHRSSLSFFPPEIDGWSGSASAIPERTERVLSADDYVHVDYWRDDERALVNFWVAYYAEQTRNSGSIHSPEACLPGDGWKIIDFRRSVVSLDDNGGSMKINRVIIEKDGGRNLVYYWFDGRGRRETNEFVARTMTKIDNVVFGRTDGALVRFVTPILSDEPERYADERIARLLRSVLPHLPRFVPA
jgi:EpsI family protein